MRLGREELDILHAIEDQAIACCRLPGGRVDHPAAALRRMDELAALESGGHTWAATVRDSAELAGHRKAISRRLKTKVVTIPMPAGKVTMPSTYSQRRKGGGQQMAMWLHLDLDQLDELIREMEAKAETLSDRSLAMRFGLDMARKHGKPSAAEGLKAEGIDIGELAA